MFRKLCKKLVLLLSLILVATTCFGCFGNPSGGNTPNGVIVSVTGVKLDKKTIEIKPGETYALEATVFPSNATNKKVTWSSSNENIALVDNGRVLGCEQTGRAEITVKTDNGKFEASCIVIVSQDSPVVSVTGVTLKNSETLKVGGHISLTPTIKPLNATNKEVTWRSSDPSVATVKNGTVNAVKEGKTDIIVTTVDGNFSAKCVLTVVAASPSEENVAVNGIILNETSISIKEGKTNTIIATVLPADASNKAVVWSSLQPTIATVSIDGTITAKRVGTAIITATTVDGSFVAECIVTVEPIASTDQDYVAVTNVRINKTVATLNVGDTEELVATVEPENASIKTLTWTSLTPSVATVNSEGVVTAKRGGFATIKATSKDGYYSAKCVVTVVAPVDPDVPDDDTILVTNVVLNKTDITLNIGGTEQLSATVIPSNATNKAVTWSVVEGNCITVNNGLITATAEGEATVVVTTVDGSKTATCSVTVLGDNPGGDTPGGGDTDDTIHVTGVTLDQESVSMLVNGSVKLKATVEPSNATDKKVIWSSSDSACVDVFSGTLYANSEGVATITATTRDGSFTATCIVTVEANPEEGGGDEPGPGVVADDPIENSQKYLATVDNVGREIKIGKEKSQDYYVGIFYHLWHGDFSDDPAAQGPNSAMPSLDYKNIQQLLDIGNNKVNPDTDVTGLQMLFGTAGQGQFYYWNEPLYGYYSSMDRWVLTRHVELFTTAGLDYLCIDATNPFRHRSDGSFEARLFKKPVETLLSILLEMQDQGFNVPKLMFYTNTGSSDTVQALYDEYYTNPAFEKYETLWFSPNGKPLIVGITEKNAGGTDQNSHDPSSSFYRRTITQAEHWHLLEYFEIKDSKWPSAGTDIASQTNAMPWMEWNYPQAIFSASKGAQRDGYAAIPLAQHGNSGYSTSVSSQPPMGHRGYNPETRVVEGDWKDGLQYQKWWDTIIARPNQIKTVMVTGWNEWIAQKQAPSGEYINKPTGNTTGVHFVDVYNNAYSRDAEMMKAEGGYGDNYYLQTIYNLRRLKREDITNPNFPSFTLDMNNDLATMWTDMGTTYKDFEGDALARAHWDASGATYYYEDKSNRNDIVNIKVTHDDNYYYFYVDTATNITAHNGTDTNWMNLFIGTEYGANTFAGFNYVINRNPNVANGTTSIHKYNNGSWESVGTADIKVQGNMMMLRIPRSLVGKTADAEIRFKVSDNVQNQNNIMDYYVTGDSAPIGRLGFVYGC